jgi:hypothetical protein
MIDPRQGEIISEFMDYQRSADPAGCSELDLSTSELSLLMATPNCFPRHTPKVLILRLSYGKVPGSLLQV